MSGVRRSPVAGAADRAAPGLPGPASAPVAARRIAEPLGRRLRAVGSGPVDVLMARDDVWILAWSARESESGGEAPARWARSCGTVDWAGPRNDGGEPVGPERGDLVQIVARGGLLPPFGMEIDRESLAGLRAGPWLEVFGSSLRCGELALDVSRAASPRMRVDWEALRGDGLPGRLAQLGPIRLPPGVRGILQGDLDRLTRAFERSGGPGVACLRGAGAAAEPAVLEAVRRLAGRGPGLTPAGDDLLLGALHGLWARGGDGSAIAARWAAEAGPRTTRLSRAWLEAAARGEVGEVWLAFLEALLGGDVHDRAGARRRVLTWGATSGQCSLVGFQSIAGYGGPDPEGAP